MRSYAAIDLRGGAVVQLVGGDPGEERVRRPDPAAVAREWLDAGFRHLHVVDLDAALGTGANPAAVEAIAAEARGRALLQVGGGLRNDEAVARALRFGADRATVGTRAVGDREWLRRMADRYPARLVVAADVRDGVVLSRGWTRATALEAQAFLAELDELPLAAVLVTDVAREGRQVGVDAPLFQRLVAATRHPVLAAGGIGAAADLRLLERAGAAGAVLGMALYTGRISPADALEMDQS
ncbi:MAG TPA: HisA/HisF-related TIM barrel protein [Longimicrobiaceae bacterium]|nr:HisA/HisF-related TIM barrel protein [Longimicrobiaceae bacterium]